MRRTPTAIPYILADTSALLDLAKAQADMPNVTDNATVHHAASFPELMDALTGKRTLVLTREVFRELFPTATGRLDIAQDADGRLHLPQGVGTQMFNRPDSQIIYRLLQDYESVGKLRFYANPKQMLAAGELERGGIAVVDTGDRRESYPEDGHKISRAREYFPPDQVVLDRARERAAMFAPRGNAHTDAGDASLLHLLKDMSDWGTRQHQDVQPLLLSSDNGLLRAVQQDRNLACWPVMPRSYEVIGALAIAQKMKAPNQTFHGYRDAIIHDRTFGGTKPFRENPEAEAKSMGRTIDWLNATAEHAGPNVRRFANESRQPGARGHG